MGTREYLLDKAKREGLEKGLAQGLEKGLEQGVESKSYEFVNNLLKQTDFDDSRISILAGVSIDFVRKVRESSGRK